MPTVIETVLQKCRLAMLSSVPVIFIKTDSDLFIHRLIEEKNNPLVTLRYGDPIGNKNTVNSALKGRPFTDSRLGNVKPNLINNTCVSNYWEITDDYELNSFLSGINKIKYPSVFSFKLKAGETPQGTEGNNFKPFEKYVLIHEDDSLENSAVLQSCVLILYAAELPKNYPEMLRTYTEIIDVDVPNREELRSIVSGTADMSLSIYGDSQFRTMLDAEMQGFTIEEAETTMQRVNAAVALEKNISLKSRGATAEKTRKRIFKSAKRVIADRKRQKTEGSPLELCQADGSIGGMDALRKWLLDEMRGPVENYDVYSRFVGVRPPKGVLLCGIPGCGKSEAAKFTAATLEKPLLKMDMGSLMNSLLGESEQKMRQALRTAETVAPCVLWIDELEKGFSDAKADSGTDSGTFKRMFAYMLNWMQENTAPVFVFATANNIGGLPKEFFRSGRFDALFGVYLPTEDECVAIFKKSMERCEKAVTQRTTSVKTLFTSECNNSELLKRVLREKLVNNGTPRIVIGSDIQNIVNVALRSFMTEDSDSHIIINYTDWINALKRACDKVSVYGDGAENVESIAVSYCRMLRKGIKPTTAKERVLFSCDDYHAENYEKLEKLEYRYYRAGNEMSESDYEEQKKEFEILKRRELDHTFGSYDRAVYDLLFTKINEIAKELEKIEKEDIIKG